MVEITTVVSYTEPACYKYYKDKETRPICAGTIFEGSSPFRRVLELFV